MKIMIWGTGAIAKQFLEENIYEVLQDAIVAFVDNDIKKVGGQFMGKNVISPTQIKDYNFDKICIFNSYVEEIKQQAVNELQLEADKLVGTEAFEDIITKVLIENYDIQTKRCLVIGDEKIYNRRKDAYESLFNIVGFVEVNRLENVKKYQYDYVLLMDLMLIMSMDRRKGRATLEKELKQKLIGDYGLKTPIFIDEIWNYICRMEHYVSWGEENPDKIFLVIKRYGGGGLGAYVNTIEDSVHYAIDKGYIPVIDMMTYKNQYLKDEEIGKVNAWEKFFEQPAGYSMSDIKKSKNIVILYNKPYSKRKQKELFFLKEKTCLVEKTVEFLKKYLWEQKKILGVLVRGTDYVNCRPYAHSIQPGIDMVLEKVKETMNIWDVYDYIYVCTEVQEYIERFKEEFGDRVIFYPQRRIRADYSEFLCEQKNDREEDEYYRGAEYWIALKILSRCNALIGGDCGGTRIVQKLNDNKYEHKYLFYLGRYWIDDIE